MFRFRPPIFPLGASTFGGWNEQRAAWKAQKAAWRAQHRAWKAQQRRPRSFFGRLMGFAWGMFWIAFGLAFAFGGDSFRNEVISFVRTIPTYCVEFFQGLMRGAWIQ